MTCALMNGDENRSKEQLLCIHFYSYKYNMGVFEVSSSLS